MSELSRSKNQFGEPPNYMFAQAKPTLLRSLETLRRRICHYGPDAQRCDCKFASYGENGPGIFHYAIGQGEVSGCAEIEQAIRFFEAMTGPEFDRIYKRQMRSRSERKDRLPYTAAPVTCPICIPKTQYSAWEIEAHLKRFHSTEHKGELR